jgi:hypothetical protein
MALQFFCPLTLALGTSTACFGVIADSQHDMILLSSDNETAIPN